MVGYVKGAWNASSLKAGLLSAALMLLLTDLQLAGCGGAGPDQFLEGYEAVRDGMAPADVRALMGEPDRVIIVLTADGDPYTLHWNWWTDRWWARVSFYRWPEWEAYDKAMGPQLRGAPALTTGPGAWQPVGGDRLLTHFQL